MWWFRRPRPDETEIVGQWTLKRGRFVASFECHRIQALAECRFEHVANDPESGGWDSLYRDPRDNRYWERTYPHSEMHGGGPPTLRVIDAELARRKYRL